MRIQAGFSDRAGRLCKLATVLPLIAASAQVQAQTKKSQDDYPNRPIRIVVTFPPASASDFLARQVSQKMTEHWGQQVVVDNRPSAGGTIAGEIVTRATPDGYTLMVSSSAIASSAALYPKLPYDTLKDFAPISRIAAAPLVIVTPPQSGIKTVKELIAAAQQKPGLLTFGHSGIGSGNHYASELFSAAAGIKTLHVPYKGAAAAMNDVASQRINYAFAAIAPAIPVVKSSRVVAVAVTSSRRSHALPDVPTVSESGVPGYEYMGWFGMFGPGKLPAGLVQRLNAEVARILALPDVRERILNLATNPEPSTPQALYELVRSEIETRRKLFGVGGDRFK